MKKLIFVLILFVSGVLFAGGHKHHFGIFTGMTNNSALEHTDFTLGADYEYRVSDTFGAGVIGDFIIAEHSEYLAMAGLFVHPSESFKINVGNGLAFAEEVDEHGETESVSHYVLRLGAVYDVHVGHFTVSPTLNVDFINGHKSVAYGLTFGMGF